MSGQNENYWISLSDLMTGLMVIFLFIAISYIKSQRIIFEEFGKTQNELSKEFQREFKNVPKEWGMSISEEDLSIKFGNPELLFEPGKDKLKPKFKNILIKFLPKYFDVILKDKYRNAIMEVRIEGHSDPNLIFNGKYKDSYLDNLDLSQKRALSVLAFYRELNHYKNLSKDKKVILDYWITANGLSYGRTLNKFGEQITPLEDIKDRNIDYDKSRRVEFKIVTNSKSVVDKFLDSE